MQVQSLIFPSSGHGRGFRTRSSNGSIGLRKPRRGQTRKMMSPSKWWLFAWFRRESLFSMIFKGHRLGPRGGSLCSGTFLRKMLVASWRYTYNDTAWCLIQDISQENQDWFGTHRIYHQITSCSFPISIAEMPNQDLFEEAEGKSRNKVPWRQKAD